MMKVLVTGANGFVGSALCAGLQTKNISFVPAVRRGNGENQISVGNMDRTTQWAEALTGTDTVVHLAARVHVMNEKSTDPLTAFRAVNVDATLNLARQAVQYGVKRFVFVSSVKVNGEETTSLPFTALDVAEPVDPYGRSKLEAENSLRDLSHKTGLELVIIRPPLVYGPGVRANFYRLMQMVKMRIPLPLACIDNRRSMVALDNLVDLLILSCSHPMAAGQCFMVSDDHDVSISELLRGLATAMNRRALLLPVPPSLIISGAAMLGKSAEASRLLGSLQVDISHTKQALGWKPVASVEESLRKTVEFFLQHY